jgi:transposase
MRSPGPLRAFGQRVRARRNNTIVTVAVARKLACLTWQLLTHQQDYIDARPALTFRKLRQLGLAAGAPKRSTHAAAADRRHPHHSVAQWATEREAALHVEERHRTAVAYRKP